MNTWYAKKHLGRPFGEPTERHRRGSSPSEARFYSLRLATALLAVLALLSPVARAEVTISGPRHLELGPGETYTAEYTLTNDGDEAVQATVFYNDYAQLPDSSLVHIPAGSLTQSLFRIAAFDRLEFSLPPKSSASLPLRIEVPKEALGGYWGVVGVETPPPPAPEGQNAVGIHVRYAMVTALDVSGSMRSELRIENLTAVTTDTGVSAVNLTLFNAGNVYERYDLDVSFENVRGETFEMSRTSVILPGQSVDLLLPVPDELLPGNYGVFASLTYRSGASAEAVGTLEVIR